MSVDWSIFRSLIALSLILAMLLFKPAPIYILDEVDAALDISHTQNIGQMIKSHFKHSQVNRQHTLLSCYFFGDKYYPRFCKQVLVVYDLAA